MKCYCDRFLYLSIIIAHSLLLLSFSYNINFWIIFSISYLVLISIALMREKMHFTLHWLSLLKKAIPSGIILYLLFYIGRTGIDFFQLPLINDLQILYSKVQPREWWQYLLLFLIIIPGEELFWRGYLQKRLSYYLSPMKGIIYSTLLYASAHIYANSSLLIIAAILAGTVWGYLYYKTNNIWIPILSHVTFNLLLLVIYPLL